MRTRSVCALWVLLAGSLHSGTAAEEKVPPPVRLGRPGEDQNQYLLNVPSVAFSSDGKRLAWVVGEQFRDYTRGKLVIHIWDVKGQKEITQIRPETSFTWAGTDVEFSRDGKLVFVGTFNPRRDFTGGRPSSYQYIQVKAWKIGEEDELYFWEEKQDTKHDALYALRVGPAGTLTAVWPNGTRTVKIPSGKEVHAVKLELGYYVDLSADGRLVLGGADLKVIRVVATATGKEIRKWEGADVGIPLALSADGKLVASRHGGKVVVLDVATGKQVVSLKGTPDQKGRRRMFCFAPAGNRMAWAEGKKIILADVASGQRLAELPVDVGCALTFSPDGSRLAALCPDATVLLWDLTRLEKR